MSDTHQSDTHKRDFSINKRLPGICALAMVIGVTSTVAAYVLRKLIFLCTNLFFYGTYSFVEHSPAQNTLGAWVILVPAVGGLIVGIMARYGSEKIRGHGIPEAIESILFNKSRMSPKVLMLKPTSAAIVIGSGGPFGSEGPIIVTGGALGSLVAQFFHLTAGERKTLLVAGAAAGMTAVFNTPIAAVLLAVELLLFEWRPRSFLPVALACAVAGFTRDAWFGADPLFPLQTALPGSMAFVSAAIVGLASGVLACTMSASLYKLEELFDKLPLHWMWWPALGGLVVGLGGLIEPRALGVGYDVIGDLLHQHLAIKVAIAILVVKAIIWLVALASGTSGGVLAPLLMLGAGLGAALGHVLPGAEPTLWPLVGMTATLGSTLGAPLTAIVFAFGLTHDSNAMMPLLMATLVAHGFSTIVMRRSILTEKITRRGYHIYREYGIDPLERNYVDDVMTREVKTIDATLSVGEALATFFGEHQTHRAYPVVRGDKLVGMVDRMTLTNLRAANDGDGLDTALGDALDGRSQPVALADETCRLVATRLAVQGLERLPVVADRESLKLIGIAARSDLVKLASGHFEEEHKKERFRRVALLGSPKRRSDA